MRGESISVQGAQRDLGGDDRDAHGHGSRNAAEEERRSSWCHQSLSGVGRNRMTVTGAAAVVSATSALVRTLTPYAGEYQESSTSNRQPASTVNAAAAFVHVKRKPSSAFLTRPSPSTRNSHPTPCPSLPHLPP